MAAVSPFSEVEDIRTTPKQDILRSVAIVDSAFTAITVANRCYGVEVWEANGTSALLINHQTDSDTVTETLPAGERLRKGFDVDHFGKVEDDMNAMRPGALIGYFKSPSGNLNVIVKEITNE